MTLSLKERLSRRIRVTDPKSLPGARWAIRRLPLGFLRHWVYPWFVRGPRRSYEAHRFFESWYGSSPEFSDGATLSIDYDPVCARFHYNSTENSLIRWFGAHGLPDPPKVLDVGSGAGHWLGFYHEVLRARSVTGIEISETACGRLAARFKEPTFEIRRMDICNTGFDVGRFDVVNAIGVMFHIVDDAAWGVAVGNLARSLERGGVMMIGGQFGWLTRDIQFCRTDSFASAQGMHEGPSGGGVLVYKRIRSLRRWRKAATESGLKVNAVIRTRIERGLPTPENNILVLSKA